VGNPEPGILDGRKKYSGRYAVRKKSTKNMVVRPRVVLVEVLKAASHHQRHPIAKSIYFYFFFINIFFSKKKSKKNFILRILRKHTAEWLRKFKRRNKFRRFLETSPPVPPTPPGLGLAIKNLHRNLHLEIFKWIFCFLCEYFFRKIYKKNYKQTKNLHVPEQE